MRLLIALLATAPLFGQVPSVTWTKVARDSSMPDIRGYLSIVPYVDSPAPYMAFFISKPIGSFNSIYSDRLWLLPPGNTTAWVDYAGNPTTGQPAGNITIVSAANPAVVGVQTDEEFRVGWPVKIMSATGTCTGLNGDWTVTAVSGVNVTVTANGTGCAGGSDLSAARILNYGCLGGSTFPANGHPGVLTYDPVRKKLYSFGRLNSQACGVAADQGTVWSADMTQPAASAIWHLETTATPSLKTTETYAIYDPDDDVHWVNLDFIYCETNSDPTMRAKQVAAGCVNGGQVNSITTTGTKPTDSYYWSHGTYDSIHKKVIHYGGTTPSETSWPRNLYTYDIPTKTWALRKAADGTSPPAGFNLYHAIMFDPTTGLTIWMYIGGETTPGIYAYDYTANTWTQMTSSGVTQPLSWTACSNVSSFQLACDANIGFDPVGRRIIAMAKDTDNDHISIYTGQLSGAATVTTLTVQEALFNGDQTGRLNNAGGGLARTNEPFSMGVPIADSLGITSTANLQLSGSSAGQFRILGRWPSGNAKWIKVSGIVPSLSAGSTTSIALTGGNASTNTGCGTLSLPNGSDTSCTRYGGSILATDNGSTITVNTGAANFTIKKANFNVLDSVVIGGTTVVASSASATRGLVLTGPSPTAGTTYTSHNAEPYNIVVDSNDTLFLGANGGQPQFVTLAPGAAVTAASVASQINTAAIPGLSASTDGVGHVVLTSSTTGRASSINVVYDPYHSAHGTIGLGELQPDFTIQGVYMGSTACSPEPGGSTCNTTYSSANDSTSTCAIEENGPVQAVIRCTGSHKDGSGNPYMQFTVRETFWVNKTSVAVHATLRNANFDTSTNPSPDCHLVTHPIGGYTYCSGNSFLPAAKGIKSYEMRIAPNISGTLSYNIATDSTAQTGTIASSDTVYVFQGTSTWQQSVASPDTAYCEPGTAYCADKLTTVAGYTVKKNSTTLASGGTGAVIGGWADCANSSGVGMSMGIEHMSAEWDTSLECNATGADFRVGLFSQFNTKNVYMPWPVWNDWPVWLDFHTSAPSSVRNNFWAFQFPLIARPSFSYVNTTNVFPSYPILDPAVEDAYYVGQVQGGAGPATPASPATLPLSHFCYNGNTSNCTPDRGMQNDVGQVSNGIGLWRYRYYAWSSGGSLNQADFRWFDLMKYYQRGYTGRFLNSRNFYRYLGNWHWPHADGASATSSAVNGFTWRSRGGNELELGGGTPMGLISSNSTLKQANNGYALSGNLWRDNLHDHWYGMADYYMMTGDEGVKEAIVPNLDYYLNTNTAAYGTTPTNNAGISRAFGVWTMATAKYNEYLNSIGDSSNAAAVLASGVHHFDAYINTQSCAGGKRPGQSTMTYYPTGCTVNDPTVGYVGGGGSPGWLPGMSYERGAHQSNSANNYCAWNTGSDSGMFGFFRIEQAFQQAILMEGIMQLRRVKGPTWSNYNRAADLAYGLAQNNLLELFTDDGQNHWQDGTGLFNGFAYFKPLDYPVQCPAGTTNADGALLLANGKLYDKAGVVNGAQNLYPTFYTMADTIGDATWQRKFNIAFQQGSTATSAWLGDWGMPYISKNIYTINNPPARSMVRITPASVTHLGGGTYRLTFTTPAGTCTNDPSCTRVKWSPKIIRPHTELLGMESLNTNTWTYDPETYATWFASNNVWPEPTATPGVQQTFDVSTGNTGLNANNFYISAMAPASPPSCDITTTSLPAATVGQNYSQTLTNNGACASSSWTGWSTCQGLSLNSASGVLSGVVTGSAGSCSGTVAYDTDSQLLSVTINAAPTISTTSLPNATQAGTYNQSLTVAGGTGTSTCAISSGSLTGSGITLTSGCALASFNVGTPATYTFSVAATDSNGITGAPRSLSITVDASSSPSSIGSVSGSGVFGGIRR